MTPVRVLHVVPHLDRVGGYERQALALAGCQRRLGAADPILLTHRDRSDRPTLEQGLSGEVHRLDRGILRHHPGAWWRRRGDDVQLVHAHALHKLSGQLLALAGSARLPSLVKVATEDDVHMFADPTGWEDLLDGDDNMPGGVRWWWMISTAWRRLRKAGRFVALNASIEDQLKERGLPCVRLPNGVDLQRFRPPEPVEREAAREALRLPSDAVCIAAVGRLCRRKAVPMLARAFQRLLARGDRQCHLVVAGEGPDEPLVRRILDTPATRGRISVLGTVDDVRDVLFAADVFVHGARREGMPNAVLEAMACGLPCVLSDIQPHRDLLAGRQAGLLFPVDDEVALAARLAGLVQSPGRREPLGREARRLAEDQYDLVAVTRAYQQLYRELLDEGAGGLLGAS